MTIDKGLINQTLFRIAENAIRCYGSNPGAYPPGINGPHNDKVTNVRVVSHYFLIFYHLYFISGEKKYKFWCLDAIDHILRYIDETNYFFHNRETRGKDPNNGLIGQVWCLEPFIVGRELISNKQLEKVKRVIRNHDFSDELSLFKYPVPGSNKPSQRLNYTLNQQIWFAMIVSKFNDVFLSNIFSSELASFNNNILNYININKQGLLNNLIQIRGFRNYNLSMKNDLKKIFKSVSRLISDQQKFLRSSYSLFSLVGIVNSNSLKEKFDLKFGIDSVLKKHINNKLLFSDKNVYSWGYNVSGIELARLENALNGNLSMQTNRLLLKQLEPTPSFGIADDVTYRARLYELVYLAANYQNIY